MLLLLLFWLREVLTTSSSIVFFVSSYAILHIYFLIPFNGNSDRFILLWFEYQYIHFAKAKVILIPLS